MTAAVELKSVSKSFGGNKALDGVDLRLNRGEMHAVIGPNGAGKSTLFAAIAGEFPLDRGTVYLDGRDITRVAAQRRVRLGIGRVFQVARLFPSLSVVDNLTAALVARQGRAFAFWSAGTVRRTRAEAQALLEELRLGPLSHHVAGQLSQGDRKRLEIAMVLALQPRVLLLDEPTAGMSPEETEETVSLIGQLWSARKLSVLITEHDMNVVFNLAQTITVMVRGTVLCTGEPDVVRTRPDVAEVYLGEGSK